MLSHFVLTGSFIPVQRILALILLELPVLVFRLMRQVFQLEDSTDF